MVISMGLFFRPILIRLIIVLGSDPTNRYGNIEKERVNSGLLAIAINDHGGTGINMGPKA